MRGGVSIARIRELVAANFGVTDAQLVGDRRDKQFVRPRHVAIYLACRWTQHSLCVVGRHFGDRDHSTIFNAKRKTAQRRAIDRELDQRIRAIEDALSGPQQRPEVQLAFLIGPLFDRDPATPQPTLRILETAR